MTLGNTRELRLHQFIDPARAKRADTAKTIAATHQDLNFKARSGV
jgi:hypothetical protein